MEMVGVRVPHPAAVQATTVSIVQAFHIPPSSVGSVVCITAKRLNNFVGKVTRLAPAQLAEAVDQTPYNKMLTERKRLETVFGSSVV